MNLPEHFTRDLVFTCFELSTNNTEKNYVVRVDSNTIYVVFRPTQGSFWDWFINFFFSPFFQVHVGFELAFLGCFWGLLYEIRTLKKENNGLDTLVFTGFSRGGMLAEMFAIEPAFKEYNPIAISFAAPKFTRKKITAENILRIKVGGDIVTRIPFTYREQGHILELDWKLLPSFSSHRFSVYRKALQTYL